MKYTVEINDCGTFYYKEGTTVLHREDGPAVEYVNGNKFWYINGKKHREDGPAVECPNGHKEYWIGGLLHREDGPAWEYSNGDKFWYINGKQLTEEEFNNRNKSQDPTF